MPVVESMKGEHVEPGIKILTVEDELAVRSSMVAFLEDLGYQVSEAEDGQGALSVFEREQPDLVLCDLRLPGMDGLDVLSKIVERSPDTPVIVVSGANRMSDAIQAIKRGAWDYVPKPITDMALLDSTITRSLDRARLRRENREHQERLERLNRQLTRAVEQLREDEEAAHLLQTRMLPAQQQRFGPFEFRQRIFSSMYLSGDFVDYFRIDQRRIGFYMADVSGHGAASALVTVMLKTLIEKYRERDHEEADQGLLHPARLLANLNQDLYQMGIDKYLTIFYGVLESDSGVLHYCSGGHFPPPVLLEREGSHMLKQHDQPVGLFEDATYTDHRLQLPERFLLLLVSDGLLELFPRDHRERGRQLVADVTGDGFSIDTLIDKYQVAEPQELPDDVALLSLSNRWGDE